MTISLCPVVPTARLAVMALRLGGGPELTGTVDDLGPDINSPGARDVELRAARPAQGHRIDPDPPKAIHEIGDTRRPLPELERVAEPKSCG